MYTEYITVLHFVWAKRFKWVTTTYLFYGELVEIIPELLPNAHLTNAWYSSRQHMSILYYLDWGNKPENSVKISSFFSCIYYWSYSRFNTKVDITFGLYMTLTRHKTWTHHHNHHHHRRHHWMSDNTAVSTVPVMVVGCRGNRERWDCVNA